MIWTVLICALCAAGLLAAVWLLAAAFLLPVRDDQTCMVLLASADAERLEQQCRAYLLLNAAGLLRRPLLLTDDGLTDAGRAAASLLARDHPQITLCSKKELMEYLHTEY